MKDYRVMFLRGRNNHPVGCVAMQLFGDRAVYQVSTLNPSDNFDRRMARQLAIGRLVESPIHLVTGSQDSVHDTTKAIMKHMSDNILLPKRSRVAAKRWINENKFAKRF